MPRLRDSLTEVALELEPAGSFGTVTVRVHGAAQVVPLGIEPDRLIGVVHFWREKVPSFEFAVHARALLGRETIAEVPAGEYRAFFQAVEAYLEVDAGQVAIGRETLDLDFDCSGAGTLRLDVVHDGQAHEGRVVVQVRELPGQTVFFAVFSSPPYVVPALLPGTFALERIAVDGAQCRDVAEVTVFAGQVSVARIDCASATAADAR